MTGLMKDAPTGRRYPQSVQRPRTLWPVFALFNAAMVSALAVGLGIHSNVSVGLAAYVMVLAFCCSLPLVVTSSMRGRQALQLAFLAFFFGTFALQDLSVILTGADAPSAPRGMLFTDGEFAIILTAICFMLGYGLALLLIPASKSGMCRRDWSPIAIKLAGVVFWAVGFVAVFVVQTQWKAVTESPFWSEFGGVLSLLRLLNPLGALMMIYSYIRNRERSALLLFLVFCIMDFLNGFYGDTKEVAFRDPVLYLVATFLLRGRVPAIPALIVFLFAASTFSFFAQFREEVHANHKTNAEAAAQVLKSVLSLTSTAPDDDGGSFGERFSHGLDYLATRGSLKGSVEMVLERTGDTVPFQGGWTIGLLKYAFIPRNIMPDKPDSSIGRQINRTFKVSADPNTYISAGMNAELYWNFGWPGIVIGMTVFGGVLGSVNAMNNFDRLITLPRLLILLMTFYVICLRFEGGIALQFTYWMRVMLMLLAVHILMPKARQLPVSGAPGTGPMTDRAKRAKTEATNLPSRREPHHGLGGAGQGGQ